MTSYLQSAMYWLPPFLVILSCAWILSSDSTRIISDGSSESRRNGESGGNESVGTTPKVHVMQKIKKGRYIAGLVLSLTLGMYIGYMSRDHQLISNRFTYTDVAISARVSDSEFWVWPDRMKQLHITLCPESTVGWYAGETLADWTFEQRKGCKRVISYHEKPKGELNANATIQAR